MFDIWSGDVNIGIILLICTAAVLPLQLLLCFRVKSRAAQLSPLCVFALLAAAFLCFSWLLPGWDGVGYVIFAIYAALMALMCIIGWGIWAVIKRIRK